MRIIKLILLLLIISCSGRKGTVPDHNKLEQITEYKDVNALRKKTNEYLDSVMISKNPPSKSKIMEIRVDTIFYGSDNKICYLALIKRHNPYITQTDKSEFIGKAFIGYKNTRDFFIEGLLKYSVTGAGSYEVASKSLREIYLRELDYIDGQVSIDDSLFWKSHLWE